eukprot:COSAG01_NODE_1656_length_9595_cov_4.929150_14_plen_58_part_00
MHRLPIARSLPVSSCICVCVLARLTIVLSVAGASSPAGAVRCTHSGRSLVAVRAFPM